MLRLATLALSLVPAAALAGTVELGPGPAYLIVQLPDGPLKTKLASCAQQDMRPNAFLIGHRGAPMMFPEHTVESYKAAAVMGTGIMECDVTFTADKELVCHHAQNDLHTTTNILAIDLAAKCTTGFTPATAAAKCRASDITLAEFKSLNGKMDAADTSATTVEAYLNGTANWRTDLYATKGPLMTHAQSVALFKDLGVKFTPELKSATVAMPYNGFSQEDYAQKLVDDYKASGVPAFDIWLQSFNLDDVLYWFKAEPAFGTQAVYLDDSYDIEGWSPSDPSTWTHTMAALKAMGVNYIAPPMWVLVALEDGKMVPSAYAKAAKAADLNIITWTLERSGPLANGGGWYFQTVKDAVSKDGAYFEILDVLGPRRGRERRVL